MAQNLDAYISYGVTSDGHDLQLEVGHLVNHFWMFEEMSSWEDNDLSEDGTTLIAFPTEKELNNLIEFIKTWDGIGEMDRGYIFCMLQTMSNAIKSDLDAFFFYET